MLNEIIKNAQHNYKNMLGFSEEDIKNQVVIPFLKDLGYKKEWFAYEKNTKTKGRKDAVDVCIFINRNPQDLFYIETKNLNHKLDSDTFTQTSNYIHNSDIEWAILTNGNIYILMNKNINGNALQKEVMRYYLFEPKLKDLNYSKIRNKSNLKFFSYNYLFKRKLTNYFKYLSDFKISKKNLNSYRQYESTLYNYFHFLSEQNYDFNINLINPATFKDFLIKNIENTKNKTPNKYIKHIYTITNKYAHIRGFYSTVLENVTNSNPFKNVTEQELIDDISLIEEKKNSLSSIEPLKKEEIYLLLNSYDFTRSSLRNKIIFLLFLYTGLDNSELINLKINDLKKDKLCINKREIPIPPKLYWLINKYLDKRDKEKIKCDYLICAKYENSYSKLEESGFYHIISKQVDKLDQIPEDRRKLITSSFIKWSLIKQMFSNGFHIEDIVKFTGLSLSSIGEYITVDDINSKAKLTQVVTKHPYQEILDNIDI